MCIVIYNKTVLSFTRKTYKKNEIRKLRLIQFIKTYFNIIYTSHSFYIDIYFSTGERRSLLDMEVQLQKRVKGQEDAISSICKVSNFRANLTHQILHIQCSLSHNSSISYHVISSPTTLNYTADHSSRTKSIYTTHGDTHLFIYLSIFYFSSLPHFFSSYLFPSTYLSTSHSILHSSAYINSLFLYTHYPTLYFSV